MSVAGGRAQSDYERKLYDLLMVGCIVIMVLLASINGAVRALGGSPNLFSPFYLGTKLSALRSYAAHLAGHPFHPCNAPSQATLRRAARQYGIPEDLVVNIAKAESEGVPHRVSHAGAMGVMQLMPGTARELGVADPFDPEENLNAGVRYLKILWQRYHGDRLRVSAAYNAGPGNVPQRGPLALPAETRLYVGKVSR